MLSYLGIQSCLASHRCQPTKFGNPHRRARICCADPSIPGCLRVRGSVWGVRRFSGGPGAFYRYWCLRISTFAAAKGAVTVDPETLERLGLHSFRWGGGGFQGFGCSGFRLTGFQGVDVRCLESFIVLGDLLSSHLKNLKPCPKP